MKILLNRTYDNFTMSQKAIARYNELAGTDYRRFDYIGENILEEYERGKEFEKRYNEIIECKYCSVCNIILDGDNIDSWVYLDKVISRNNKHLLQVFEELGDEFLEEDSSALRDKLEVVEIPDNVDFKIVSSDKGGSEFVKYFTYTINKEKLTNICNNLRIYNGDIINRLNDIISNNPNIIKTKEIYV